MKYQVSEQQLFPLIDGLMKKIYGDISFGPISNSKIRNIQGSSSWRYYDPEYPPFTIELDDNGKVISMSRNFTPFEHKKIMKLTGLDEKTILKIFFKFNFNLDFADDFEFLHT